MIAHESLPGHVVYGSFDASIKPSLRHCISGLDLSKLGSQIVKSSPVS